MVVRILMTVRIKETDVPTLAGQSPQNLPRVDRNDAYPGGSGKITSSATADWPEGQLLV